MQSKLSSLQEAIINTMIGFFLSLAVQQFIVNPLYDLHVSFVGNLGIVAIFTVVSVLRSYALRRVFNHKLTRK